MAKKSGRTQADLAEFWGVDPIHLSGCLNGSRIAGRRILDKVAEIKGLPLHRFVAKNPKLKARNHPAWIRFFSKWESGEIHQEWKPKC